MRKTLAGAVIGGTLGAILGGTLGASAGTSTREVYVPRDGSGPRIVIIGSGYASAEDSVGLTLVDYDPGNNRIVYRVVVP